MRIGILSDSHHDQAGIDKALALMGEVDHIIHAGDHYADAKHIAKVVNCPVTAVKGNMDMGVGKHETLLKLEGRKIFITHGHKYHVKSGLQHLYYRALEAEADIVVFGHTHVAVYFEESNICFLNPGSVSHPYDGKNKSCAIMEIKNEKCEVKIHYFD